MVGPGDELADRLGDLARAGRREGRGAGGRTDPRGRASVELALAWESEAARHTDVVVADRVRLGGDGLPAPLADALLDRPVGHRATAAFPPGGLGPPWEPSRLLTVAAERFDAWGAGRPAPRAGRFYPAACLGGLGGDPRALIRLAEVGEDGLRVDLNPPLAAAPLRVTTTVLEAWAPDGPGGTATDIAALAMSGGPGMQARWRGQPTDFWSDAPFDRADPRPDPLFYAPARLVQHIDATAIAQVTRLYGRLVPPRARILDLMSSWVSHLPADLGPAEVIGLGMNRQELDANPQLTGRVVHDLNRDPVLPFPAGAFDGAVCTVSVDYLVRPFEVVDEVARVLRPGGRFVVTFSNRWFPPKVVRIWEECHEFERVGLVLEYFLRSGRFAALETWSVRGLPRPADDEYADRAPCADPVYAVWGTRV